MPKDGVVQLLFMIQDPEQAMSHGELCLSQVMGGRQQMASLLLH